MESMIFGGACFVLGVVTMLVSETRGNRAIGTTITCLATLLLMIVAYDLGVPVFNQPLKPLKLAVSDSTLCVVPSGDYRGAKLTFRRDATGLTVTVQKFEAHHTVTVDPQVK